jgi:hypothetical protein
MSAARALQRTVDLVRSDIFPDASPAEVIASLTGVRVRLRASEQDVSCAAGQTALATTAIVAAQSGVQLILDVADVPLLPSQPPLLGKQLTDALLEHTSDLITPATLDDGGGEADLTIAFGSTRAHDDPALRLAPRGDGFELTPADGGEPSSWSTGELFAALFGGVAAGAEAFRAAMRTLARRGHTPMLGNAVREPRAVRLAFPSPGVSVDLGRLDVISAGAITNGMLFALLRVPGICGALRIFDKDILNWANLNRYPLARQALLKQPKALVLERYATPTLQIDGVPACFDDQLAASLQLAPLVAVGVDDIPSRWRAQRTAPGTVVVGGTSHFEVVVSEHPPGEPCAGCLYRDGEDDGQPIPTVSFVSTFAGILQAYRLLAGAPQRPEARQTRAAPLNLAGSDPLVELGVARRAACPASCRPWVGDC